MTFFAVTFSALGRYHSASPPGYGHRNALFELDSRIPLVRASSELAVGRRSGPPPPLPPEGDEQDGGAQLPPSAVRAPARLLRARPLRDSPSAATRAHARFQQQPGRPDPQSQTLSRSYGSKLPTSLTYIVPVTRGCSPWRPAADMGTARCKNHDCSPGFSRAGESASDTAGSAVLYRN